jgi:hypothetical protein
MSGQYHPDAHASGRHQPFSYLVESGWTMVLMTLQLLMGFVALTCGALLMVNGLGMPQSVLDDSPFDTFVVPGLTLALIVGGSLLLSARLIWTRHHLAQFASVLTGWILLGWIVIEALMVPEGRPLQAAIFLYACVLINLAWSLSRDQLDQTAADR